MRPSLTFVTLTSALLVAAVTRAAAAMPIFPSEIETALNLSYPLGTMHCDICHHSPTGGDQVVHPFGIAMEMNGLGVDGLGSIKDALAALEAKKIDSDCDTIPDIEQLQKGRDPNPPGEYIDGSGRATLAEAGCGTVVPLYGCDARLSAGRASGEGAGVLVALGALIALRRRRVMR